jgi:carboxyl-terminal processing protease
MKKPPKGIKLGSLKTSQMSLVILRNVGIVLVVFFIGLLIGDGHIHIGSSSSVSSNLPSQLNYSSVNKVYQALKSDYDGKLTETQLLNGINHGLANSANDPYTEYFTAAEAQQFSGELNNTFSGIGADLSTNTQGDIEIMSPIAGSPASKAGLKAQDVIESINGTSTAGMSVETAVDKIRGNAGTKVRLEVERSSQTLNFNITRGNIQLPSVTSKVIDGDIGYMQISTFGSDTDSLSLKAAEQFKSDNVKAVILDLRDNPGGLVDGAVHVSSLWLNPGQKILDEKRGSQVISSNYALGNDILHGLPTVVLINSGSASASEITAGALHDNKDAYLIGQKSFGKGVVQEVVCITGQPNSQGVCPADELKVTIASWYRPDGQNINHKGITPDATVTLSTSQAASGDDTQLNAAESYLNSKITN